MNRSTAGRVALLRVIRTTAVAVVLALAACSPQDTPPSAAVSAPPAPPVASVSPAALPSSAAPTPTVRPRVSRTALNYFFRIALGAEYGDDVRVVRRWSKPVVTVRVQGTAGAAGRSCLKRVVADFNALTATTDLQLTSASAADIRLHFAPVSRFRSIDAGYVPGNDGFFSVNWRGDHTITGATVLIRTSGIRDTVRCHLIREELTQSMGLMRDSDQYPSSVFYGRYHATPTRYSSLDKQLIKLLYGGAVRPGDGKKEITRAVRVV